MTAAPLAHATRSAPSQQRRGRPARRRPRSGPLAATAVGLALLAVLAVVSVFVGARAIAPTDVLHALTDLDPTDAAQRVVIDLRLPRTALAALTGAALGVAGTIMQALTRNPLAEPGILGINAGAAACTATGTALTAGVLGTAGTFGFAFAGAAVGALAVAALGGVLRRGADPVRLTLAGAALSVMLGSYTQALLINQPTVFDTFRHWAVGSVQGRDGSIVLPALVVIVPAILLAVALGPSFNALALGDDLGRSVGASPRKVLVTGAVLVVLLAGGATAVAGPFAFVGLVAPLAVRLVTGPDHRWILPLSAVAAADLVLAADIVGRVLVPSSEVEASIVTAIVGAPVFIALARRRRLVRL